MKSLFIPEYQAFIRYHDMPGDEPNIILLHGLGSASSSDFPAAVHRPVLSRHRFILPDFFGFGFSDRPTNFSYSLEDHAETVYQIIKSINISNIYLFGHSMGGAIAIALAAAHPEHIKRLVLAEANLDPGKGQGSKLIADQSERFYAKRGHAVYIENIKKGIPKSSSLSIYAGTLEVADPIAMHRSAVGLIRGLKPSQRELFLSMKIPRAFIFGEYSLPDPDVEILSSAGINVLIIPNAGHAMMHDNPEGFSIALAKSFQIE